MQQPLAIVVMAKYPEPGRVKTRLAPILSHAQCAHVHTIFVREVLRRAALALPQARLVLCHDPPTAADPFRALLGDLRIDQFLPQSPGDLGDRLAAATEALRPSHETILFLGADAPDLPPNHLRNAATADPAAQVRLGPTADGGYWFLRLARAVDPRALLAAIPWSTGHERSRTLDRARSLGYTTALGEAWDDVDHPQDLRRLVDRLSAADPDARRLLDELRPALPAELLPMSDRPR